MYASALRAHHLHSTDVLCSFVTFTLNKQTFFIIFLPHSRKIILTSFTKRKKKVWDGREWIPSAFSWIQHGGATSLCVCVCAQRGKLLTALCLNWNAQCKHYRLYMSVINTDYLQAFVILDIHMSNAAKQVVCLSVSAHHYITEWNWR